MTDHQPDPIVSGWPAWLEQWILPYLREPSLWPVLIAVMGHVVVVVVALELDVWREGSIGSGITLAALIAATAGGCGFEVRRVGGPGALTYTLALTWAASVGGAWIAARTGVL